MPAARRAVEAAFRDGGMRYCVEIDLVDFYGSISHEGLADVLRPLPSGAVRHVVYDTTIRHSIEDESPSGVSTGSWFDPHRIGHVGLPLGSACSAVVGECIFARYLREIPDNQFIAYADNILLLGRTAEDVQVLTENLSAALQNDIGAMRFRARETLTNEMVRGFEFLGQQVTISPGEPQFVWRPSFNKIAEYLIGDWPVEANTAETDAAEAKLINWRAVYPEWPEGDATEAKGLADIACVRYFQSMSAVHRRKAISAIWDAYQANSYSLNFDEIVPDVGPQYASTRQQLIEACINRFPETRTAAE
jgi:hypothetical protein